MTVEITIPKRVEDDESSLLHLLSLLPWNPQGLTSPVIADFARVEFLTPGAIAALSAWVRKLTKAGVEIELKNAETSTAYNYLQRIDFFSSCGLALPENFTRHPTKNRFFPLTHICNMEDVKNVSSALARCIAPEAADSDDPDQTGIFDLLEYSISELATNVVQHSRSSGVVCSQYYPASDKVVLGIADPGIGIRQSFRVNGSPHWSDSMTDLEAIEKSLEFTVSSRTHMTLPWGEPINAGVGLTFLKNLVTVAGGEFYLISGTGFYSIHSGNIRTKTSSFGGTLCIMSFQRSKVSNFYQMFSKIKESFKGSRSDGHEDMFQ